MASSTYNTLGQLSQGTRAATGASRRPRTTRLYDRRDKKITRNIVERILI
jgi:hypothetical protein